MAKTTHRGLLASLLMIMILAGCASQGDIHDKPAAISPAERQPISVDKDLEAYPIKDAMLATVVGTPDKMQADLPSADDINLSMRSLEPIQKRDTPDKLRFARPLQYMLAAQDRPAPLAFVIAGTGATASSSKCVTLSKSLYQMGYSVACLPSPTTVPFMLGAAKHPMPGRMSADARDLYRMMQVIRDDVDEDLDITGYSLTGYSLGASEAAFVAKQDERDKQFDFKHVLLLNPAVNLLTSVGRMDDLLARNLPGGYDELPKFLAQVMGNIQKAQKQGSSGSLSLGDDSLVDVVEQGEFSKEDIAALVGVSFRLSLANMAFAGDLMTRSDEIVPRDMDLGAYDAMDRYFERSFRMSFGDYIDRLLLPYWNRDGRQLSKAELVKEADLRSIQDFLANDPRIGVFTNADDPILASEDVQFLRDTFGDRAHIAPHGGHMGNMEYQKTIQTIQKFFQ